MNADKYLRLSAVVPDKEDAQYFAELCFQIEEPG